MTESEADYLYCGILLMAAGLVIVFLCATKGGGA